MKFREIHYLRKYGISMQEYIDTLIAQGSCCKICKSKEPKATNNLFVPDHNHETGELRGIVCGPCNHFIGIAESRLDLIPKIMEYLGIIYAPHCKIMPDGEVIFDDNPFQ